MTVRREPPSAEEIERLFRRPFVVVARPVLLGGLEVLKLARRFGWEAEGLHHLSNYHAPFIFAANHRSHADTAAIMGTLPRRMRPRTAVAAALDVFGGERAHNPGLGKRVLPFVVAAAFRAFAFDRHGPPMPSVRTSVKLIRRNWNLLLYPEGTRSRDGQSAGFKGGVGVLARFTRRPVVPVFVEGGATILPCGAFLPRPGRIIVRYGQPMFFLRGDTTTTFMARLEERVHELGSGTPHGGPALSPQAQPVTAPATSHVENQPA